MTTKKCNIFHLADIEPKQLSKGFEARIIHSEKMTFAYLEIDKGSVLPTQKIPYEQVISMVMGEMKFTLDNEDFNFHEGMVIVIPTNVPHSGIAITRCKLLEVATPKRKDLD